MSRHRFAASLRRCGSVRASALACLALLLLPAVAHSGDQGKAERGRVRVVVPDEDRTVLLGAGRRGFLGVHVIELTPELRRHFQADEEAGVLVSRVEEDSPAAQAGIAVGDVVTAVDGETIETSWDLRRELGTRRQGESVTVDVVRDGRSRQLTATLVEREGRLLELGTLMRRDAEGRPLIVVPSGEDWEEFGERMGKIGEEVGEAVAGAMAHPQVRFRVERELQQREQLQRKLEMLERRRKELERQLEDQRR
jgi:membrane-associated protease RseP (regulator of RpoE activity)